MVRGSRAVSPFELLAELLDDLARSNDLRETLFGALQRIVDAMDAEAGGIFQIEGDYDSVDAKLICRASYGPVDLRGIELSAHEGVLGRALQLDQPLLVNDAGADPDFIPPQLFGVDFNVHSIVVAPAAFHGRRYGAVELFNRRGGGHFERRHLTALAAMSAAAAVTIHNAQLAEDLIEQARLKREVELAAGVQRNLLPPPSPEDAPIHGFSRAARGVSGDFYDILPLRDGRYAFALADVSGKGLNAALVMVKVATLFRSFARRHHEPGLLLAKIERELTESLTQGMFVTMVVGLYDPKRHEVRLANAGHLPVLLLDADGQFHSRPAQDPPLGVRCRLQHNRYREIALPLRGGRLYLYSDGATEARDAKGRQIGIEGLQRLLKRESRRSPTEALTRVAAQIDAAGTGLHDDLSLLVIEDRGHPCFDARRRRRRSPNLLVEQNFPAQPQQLKIVRRLVEAAALAAGAPPAWGKDFALAVDEACQNIIRHGYHEAPDGRIELRIRRAADRLTAELMDFAPRVDEDQCRGRSLDDTRPGGLGTHFMRMLTDQVLRKPAPRGAGNRLALVKLLPGARAPQKKAGRTSTHPRSQPRAR